MGELTSEGPWLVWNATRFKVNCNWLSRMKVFGTTCLIHFLHGVIRNVFCRSFERKTDAGEGNREVGNCVALFIDGCSWGVDMGCINYTSLKGGKRHLLYILQQTFVYKWAIKMWRNVIYELWVSVNRVDAGQNVDLNRHSICHTRSLQRSISPP